MKRFPFVYRFCLIGCILAMMFTGCALDRQGTQPSLYCGITSIEYDVGPCSDAYRFSGICAIEDETATYEVTASWKGSDGKSAAIIKANYQGNNLSESVVATCPGADPLLDANVACSHRLYNGNVFNTIPWSFEVFQNSNFIPDFLGEEIKTTLRAQAQWPKQSPQTVFPTQNFRYQDPANVPIAIALPFKKGHLSDWKINFYYRKWNGASHNWSGSPVYISMDDLYQSAAGTWVGRVFLNLEKGTYRIEGVAAYYTDGTCHWDTGWFSDNPVKFYVGPLEPYPGPQPPVPAPGHWPDYQIRSFESKVIQPGERSLTGEVVDKKSFSFRWQVKNIGKKKSPRTTFSVQCQAVGEAACPSEFPLSRVIEPIDPGSSSGQYVGITVPAPAAEAKYRFSATVNPDQSVVESNKDNNTLYSEFVHTRPKVLSDEELLQQTRERFEKPTGKDKAAPIKKISLAQVILPKKSFTRDEEIPLRAFIPTNQKGIVEVERQEGNLWLKSKEPVLKGVESIKGSNLRLMRHDLRQRQSGQFRARARIANGPWSNWTYFDVQ